MDKFEVTQSAAPDSLKGVAQQDTKEFKGYTMAAYGLYALGFFLGGLPTIAGLIVAYLKRNEFAGTIYQGHLSMLIRTFWYAVLFSIIGAVTLLYWIGGLIWVGTAIWSIYRVIRGFILLNDGKPVWMDK